MKNINIDFISENDIRITIDGEKLTEVAGFLLEIEEGKTPKYSIQKRIFQNPKLVKSIASSGIPQWRSIQNVVKQLKEEDPETVITAASIRRLVRENEIAIRIEGRRKLVDLTEVKEYYNTHKKAEDILKEERKRHRVE